MDNKWICPACGAENVEKNTLSGICWRCGKLKNMDMFDPEPDRATTKKADTATTANPREVFPDPDKTDKTTTANPREVFPDPDKTDKTKTANPREVFPDPDDGTTNPEPDDGTTNPEADDGTKNPKPDNGTTNPESNRGRGETHTATDEDSSRRRSGCMVWLVGLVAALVLLGVGIYFMKTPPVTTPPDDGTTDEGDAHPWAGKLLYVDGVNVSLYAPLEGYKPESMARMGSVVYFTQEGGLYFLKNGEVSQIDLDGWEAQTVRVWNDEEVFVLTRPREEDGAYRYTILHVYANSYAEDSLLSAHFTTEYGDTIADFDMYPTDFAVSPNGKTLWLITRHLKTPLYDGDTEYKSDTEYTLDCCYYSTDSGRYETETLETKAVFEYMVPDTNRPYMLFDADGNLYITGPEDAFVRILRKDERVLETFAGQTMDLPGASDAVIGVHGRNDSGAVTFLYPTALALDGQYLYVVDEGTVRRIPLDGVPAEGIDTLAGNVTDNAQTVLAGATVSGAEALLSTSARSGLITLDDALLLSDPETGVVYTISTKEG
ncbi:MAG: hypothetical protein IJR72_00690 [Oscillospiraceae bacterium]|nr:hypothetical protein [Oscillospiraceae bacterium]